MFSYTICNEPDKGLFKKQCLALEKNIPGIKKQESLHDVDDSLIQVYDKDGARITVYNSEYVGALYVESEIELEHFFKN